MGGLGDWGDWGDWGTGGQRIINSQLLALSEVVGVASALAEVSILNSFPPSTLRVSFRATQVSPKATLREQGIAFSLCHFAFPLLYLRFLLLI